MRNASRLLLASSLALLAAVAPLALSGCDNGDGDGQDLAVEPDLSSGPDLRPPTDLTSNFDGGQTD